MRPSVPGVVAAPSGERPPNSAAASAKAPISVRAESRCLPAGRRGMASPSRRMSRPLRLAVGGSVRYVRALLGPTVDRVYVAGEFLHTIDATGEPGGPTG